MSEPTLYKVVLRADIYHLLLAHALSTEKVHSKLFVNLQLPVVARAHLVTFFLGRDHGHAAGRLDCK